MWHASQFPTTRMCARAKIASSVRPACVRNCSDGCPLKNYAHGSKPYAPERMLWGRSVSHEEKHRILVVDGRNMIAFTLATVLRSAGFDVAPFPQPVP